VALDTAPPPTSDPAGEEIEIDLRDDAQPRVRRRVVGTKLFADKRRLALGVLATVAVVAIGVQLFEFVVAEVMYERRRTTAVSQWVQPTPNVRLGEAAGLLQIPRIKLNEVIIEGDSLDNLRSGPAHRASTPDPGRKGNAVVLGHAERWGGPFSQLGRLKKGSVIYVQWRNQDAIQYKVVSIERVGANDTRALGDSTDRRLTLVSSTGGRFSSDRIVVSAVAGKVGSITRDPNERFDPPRGSPFFNLDVFIAYGAFVAAAAAFALLRKRHSAVLSVAVAAPLLLLGGIYLGLAGDRLLAATA
jgi:sortase A